MGCNLLLSFSISPVVLFVCPPSLSNNNWWSPKSYRSPAYGSGILGILSTRTCGAGVHVSASAKGSGLGGGV